MSALFVSLQERLVEAESRREGWPIWTPEEAESLLNSLTGVMSARLVAHPPGVIDEIHLLTTDEITPKQVVRNVESALLAHFDLKIDHRTVSVAQTSERPEDRSSAQLLLHPAPRVEERFLFVAHQVETERSHQSKVRVTLEWRGERYQGEASGADLVRSRNETAAQATLRAIEAAANETIGNGGISLSLDGVKHIEVFDETFVLVAVHGIHGRAISALAGAASVDVTVDRAVILAALQATDRWVRGRI